MKEAAMAYGGLSLLFLLVIIFTALQSYTKLREEKKEQPRHSDAHHAIEEHLGLIEAIVGVYLIMVPLPILSAIYSIGGNVLSEILTAYNLIDAVGVYIVLVHIALLTITRKLSDHAILSLDRDVQHKEDSCLDS